MLLLVALLALAACGLCKVLLLVSSWHAKWRAAAERRAAVRSERQSDPAAARVALQIDLLSSAAADTLLLADGRRLISAERLARVEAVVVRLDGGAPPAAPLEPPA